MSLPAQANANTKKSAESIRLLPPGPVLDAHLNSGDLHAIYLVTSGETEDRGRNEERASADPQSLLQTARAIEKAALQGGDPTMDLVKIDYLDGDHSGVGMHQIIAHEARSVSLFGGRRVVSVVHADDLTFASAADAVEGDKPKRGKKKAGGDDALELLATALNPLDMRPPFVIILVAEHFDRRKRAFKLLATAGCIVEVPPMTVGALQAYLEATAQPYGIRVEKQVAQRIWDRLGGADAARLRQSADRLILDAGSQGVITVRLVDEAVPLDRDAASWAITDAIAAEDVTRALAVLHLMLENVTSTERIAEMLKLMGFLVSQYTNMLQVAALKLRNKQEAEIASELAIHPFRLRNMQQLLRTMKPMRLELAIITIDQADHVLKSSALGDSHMSIIRWLEQLVIALCHGTPLRLQRQNTLADAL